MKTCCICKQFKPLSEFNKNRTTKSGYHTCCKICNSKYQKKYSQTIEGKMVRRKAISRFRKTEKGKAVDRKSMARYCIRHPERRKAKAAVGIAVESGKIPHIKTQRCYFCYKQAHQYHHYKEYKRIFWLEVIPVCRECHTKIHGKVA